MDGLFPPDWFLETTGAQSKYGATLAAGTYYAPINLQGANAFGLTLISNGTLEATATVDGNDAPTSVTAATNYAATGGVTGWTDEASVADVTFAASATSAGRHVTDFERGRARVKLVVTVAGTCIVYPTVKAR